MPSAGILILLVLALMVGCVKARAAGPAAWCAGLMVLFIVSTPVGSVVPSAVAGLFSVLDGVTTPVLNHEVPISTSEDSSPGARPIGVGR